MNSGGKVTAFTPSAPMLARKRRSRSCSRTSSATSGRSRSAFSIAGSNVNKPLLETTEKLFFKAWELACYAGFLVGREATRVMLPRGRGTIFFTGATASIRGSKGFAAFSSAKFGLRALAQAMARELGPKNIHVVHLIIDAGVDSEAIHQRMKAARGIEASEIPPDSLTKTSSIAEAYWFAHQQSRDGWTHELDLRPAAEKW
ncbi:NAD(P)-dependent dehydrogenase (short-subunit alcohol dehydrogenase family) [Bradyrhizobium sp. RT3b]